MKKGEFDEKYEVFKELASELGLFVIDNNYLNETKVCVTCAGKVKIELEPAIKAPERGVIVEHENDFCQRMVGYSHGDFYEDGRLCITHALDETKQTFGVKKWRCVLDLEHCSEGWDQ